MADSKEKTVRCPYCHKYNLKSRAFGVLDDNNRPLYFCSREHWKMDKQRKIAKDLACDILAVTPMKELTDGLQEIAKTVGWSKLVEYLLSESQRISAKIISLDFPRQISKIRYFLSWITNEVMEFDTGEVVKMKYRAEKPYRTRKRNPPSGMDNLIENILNKQEGK